MAKFLNLMDLLVSLVVNGGGKTISMVEYLDRMKELYPDSIMVFKEKLKKMREKKKLEEMLMQEQLMQN